MGLREHSSPTMPNMCAQSRFRSYYTAHIACEGYQGMVIWKRKCYGVYPCNLLLRLCHSAVKQATRDQLVSNISVGVYMWCET
jgi:hypothetical protein